MVARVNDKIPLRHDFPIFWCVLTSPEFNRCIGFKTLGERIASIATPQELDLAVDPLLFEVLQKAWETIDAFLSVIKSAYETENEASVLQSRAMEEEVFGGNLNGDGKVPYTVWTELRPCFKDVVRNDLAVAEDAVKTSPKLLQLIVEVGPLGMHGSDSSLGLTVELTEEAQSPKVVKDGDIIFDLFLVLREKLPGSANGVPPGDAQSVDGIGTVRRLWWIKECQQAGIEVLCGIQFEMGADDRLHATERCEMSEVVPEPV